MASDYLDSAFTAKFGILQPLIYLFGSEKPIRWTLCTFLTQSMIYFSETNVF
jgi:hypothetical protein